MVFSGRFLCSRNTFLLGERSLITSLLQIILRVSKDKNGLDDRMNSNPKLFLMSEKKKVL